MSKQIFIQQVGVVVTELAGLEEKVRGMSGVFTARGYQAGGADAIVDDDIKSAGGVMSAAQFNALAVLLGEYLNFCNNAAVAAKDRKTQLNQARTDI